MLNYSNVPFITGVYFFYNVPSNVYSNVPLITGVYFFYNVPRNVVPNKVA